VSTASTIHMWGSEGGEGALSEPNILCVCVRRVCDPCSHRDLRRYHINTNDVVSLGNTLMCKWVLRTENATQYGAEHEFIKQGMLKCSFDAMLKITSLHLIWDVMATMLDVKLCQGKVGGKRLAPNSTVLARVPVSEPRIVFSVESEELPILEVNGAWCEMLGTTPKEIIGSENVRDWNEITENAAAFKCFEDCLKLKCVGAFAIALNKKGGESCRVYLTISPLTSENGVINKYMGDAILCSDASTEATRIAEGALDEKAAAKNTEQLALAHKELQKNTSRGRGSVNVVVKEEEEGEFSQALAMVEPAGE